MNDTIRPVVLCILDGWGHRDACENNAICQAETPTIDRLTAEYPSALIDASETEVGLPLGQMGNSEVGHMNLGAGRVVLQDLPRIDADIESGALMQNPPLKAFAEQLAASGGTAHVMGLLSPGGVHAHQEHMAELALFLKGRGIPVAVHGFLDGRDTPPQSAVQFVKDFLGKVGDIPFATISGRYYAMDRDKRWNRVELAYNALVSAEGVNADDPIAAIEQSYAGETTDEFVLPTVIGGYRGMADGDGILMANFRADRSREILTALLDPAFDGFARRRQVTFQAASGMVQYSEDLAEFMTCLYPPLDLSNTLGETVALNGRSQLRIAETEKYAHVTFFFNGGREEPFKGEERILIPSPKVATYDLQPEMSAPEVTDRLVEAVASGRFDLVVCNYANGDMVGHTGNLKAAIQAVETLDHCLSRLAEAVIEAGGSLVVTADHGNAEQMADPSTGQAHTAHTMNKVPLLLINPPRAGIRLENGCLADIAPTVLDLMELPIPAAMTGRSLIRQAAEETAAE